MNSATFSDARYKPTVSYEFPTKPSPNSFFQSSMLTYTVISVTVGRFPRSVRERL
ncbi:hypothetical protein ACFVR1_00370 [Psychrobacillus sp. NPDC058041]|uniref:hypothetical protein n=1 Tax=Psychrobacillus sp. NPDC058041 TaxID=3346310 RepID=UPI0036DCFD75